MHVRCIGDCKELLELLRERSKTFVPSQNRKAKKNGKGKRKGGKEEEEVEEEEEEGRGEVGKDKRNKGNGNKGKRKRLAVEEEVEGKEEEEQDIEVEEEEEEAEELIEWRVGDMIAVKPEQEGAGKVDPFWICKITEIFPKEPKYKVRWFEKHRNSAQYVEGDINKFRISSGAIISTEKFKMVAKNGYWMLPTHFKDILYPNSM
eukprot:Phypoly_transcript_13845.p2 GENE.Phypoly_transcript_13845~~Phypoly_transcript_13845.p2  ORF type:complete len:204 (+),score=67.82 Phypoly_transcript_13845:399-1010(+)